MEKVVSIIVTYNGIRWIERCLGSLAGSSWPTAIIIIDNGSTDGTTAYIREKFPFAELIESKENLGFGQANNIGFRIAIERKADYVFLLNQDAWIEANTIGCLLNEFRLKSGFGIISPLHLNGTGNTFDKYFLDYFIRSGIKEEVAIDLLHEKNQHLLIETSFVNAAAWCISIKCVVTTGGFDPIFFHYGEDRNYIQRASYRGFKTGIYTGTKIFHDREQRLLNSSVKPKERLNREWIHFLNHVCNIKTGQYRKTIIKRFLRYSFLAGINLVTFNKESFRYHYGMSVKIISYSRKIKRSRMISYSDGPYPHL